jgi:hypothetical protein
VLAVDGLDEQPPPTGGQGQERRRPAGVGMDGHHRRRRQPCGLQRAGDEAGRHAADRCADGEVPPGADHPPEGHAAEDVVWQVRADVDTGGRHQRHDKPCGVACATGQERSGRRGQRGDHGGVSRREAEAGGAGVADDDIGQQGVRAGAAHEVLDHLRE